MKAPTWLTARHLARLTKPVALGDITLIPHSLSGMTLSLEWLHEIADRRIPYDGEKRLREILLNWWRGNHVLAQALPPYLHYPEIERYDTFVLVSQLVIHYQRYCEYYKREPVWIRTTPRILKAHLRNEQWLWSEHIDHFDSGGVIPCSGIGYTIEWNGLIEEVNHALHVERLGGLRQLSLLNNVGAINEDNVWFSQPLYPHTRWRHVLDATVIAALIARNNKLSPDLTATLLMAAFTHDLRLPAGGDMTKFLANHLFDEDANYASLLCFNEVQQVCNAHRINEQTLVETVQGHGVLGNILDLADKIAYVARDAQYCTQWMRGPRPVMSWDIDHLLEHFPNICTIWDAIIVRDGRVFCDDADRLARFLYLRACLITMFYNNPEVQFLEAILGGLVLSHLYETNVITKEKLLTYDDDWLFYHLLRFLFPNKVVGGSPGIDPKELGRPHYRQYETLAEARTDEDKLIAQGFITTIMSIEIEPKPGIHLLVSDHGAITPLSIARPDLSRDIEQRAHILLPHRLYWIEEPTLNRVVIDQLRRIRQNQLTKELSR